MNKKKRERAHSAYPLWFRVLVPIFGGIIICGLLYALLASHGTFEPHKSADGDEKYQFHTSFQVFADDAAEGTKPEIDVQITYDTLSQKLKINTAYDTTEEINYVRLSASDFQHVLDTAGGVSYARSGEKKLSGAEAYRCALGQNPDGSSGDPAANQAMLIASFLEDMRQHSNDAVFMLKLMADASSRLDTNLGIKTLASFGKNLLKADTLSTEVQNG